LQTKANDVCEDAHLGHQKEQIKLFSENYFSNLDK